MFKAFISIYLIVFLTALTACASRSSEQYYIDTTTGEAFYPGNNDTFLERSGKCEKAEWRSKNLSDWYGIKDPKEQCLMEYGYRKLQSHELSQIINRFKNMKNDENNKELSLRETIHQ